MATIEALGNSNAAVTQIKKALVAAAKRDGWRTVAQQVFRAAALEAQKLRVPLKQLLQESSPQAYAPAIAYQQLYREGIAEAPLLPADVRIVDAPNVLPVVSRMRRRLVNARPPSIEAAAVTLKQIAAETAAVEIAAYTRDLFLLAVQAVQAGEDPVAAIKEAGQRLAREDVAEAMVADGLLPLQVISPAGPDNDVPAPTYDPTANQIAAPSETEVVATLAEKIQEGATPDEISRWLEAVGIPQEQHEDFVAQAFALLDDQGAIDTDGNVKVKSKKGGIPLGLAAAAAAFAAWQMMG